MFTNPPASIDPKVIEVLLTAVTLLSTHSRFTLALARSITLQVFGSCYKFIGIVIHYVMVPLCLLSLLFSCFYQLFSCFYKPFDCFQQLFICFYKLFKCFQQLFNCFYKLFNCFYKLFICFYQLFSLITLALKTCSRYAEGRGS